MLKNNFILYKDMNNMPVFKLAVAKKLPVAEKTVAQFCMLHKNSYLRIFKHN